MSHAEQTIGAAIRAFRLQRGMSAAALAAAVNLPEAAVSNIEDGASEFSIRQAEALSTAMGIPFRALVSAAYAALEAATAPLVDAQYLRPGVPLPAPMTQAHLVAALNDCQAVIHIMNRNMRAEIGLGLQELIQGNNFSGLVSNVLSNSFDKCTPFKHNHDQRYPDLIGVNGEQRIGLEVKTTIKKTKGGESHNGHSGWHLIACYQFTDDGDILFINVMFADLIGYGLPNADWTYVGSNRDEESGSQRTETYNTTGHGTTKLRDGSAYFDTRHLDCSHWRPARHEGMPMPEWSLFANRQRPVRVPRRARTTAAALTVADPDSQLF